MLDARSLLFVPGNQPAKLSKALACGADALILDLEDSVAPAMKQEARGTVLVFLEEHRREAARPTLLVRIHALDSPLADGDLDAVMAGGPDGIVLPKSSSGRDVAALDERIAPLEAAHDIPPGSTQILAIATESASAIFGLGTYAGASKRLTGLTWGAEDLAADIGALEMRAGGQWTSPAQLVRDLCLFGAAAAGIAAIDTVHVDFRDLDGLARECSAAARDGFTAKLAIHPAQVPVINAAFTPSDEAVAHARHVVETFSASTQRGVTSLDGQMLDRPHLKAARKLLARAQKLEDR